MMVPSASLARALMLICLRDRDEDSAGTRINHHQPMVVDPLQHRGGPRLHVPVGKGEEISLGKTDYILGTRLEIVRLDARRKEETDLSPIAADNAGKVVDGKKGGHHLELLRPSCRFATLAAGGDERDEQQQTCADPYHSHGATPGSSPDPASPAEQERHRPFTCTRWDRTLPPIFSPTSRSICSSPQTATSSTRRQARQTKW